MSEPDFTQDPTAPTDDLGRPLTGWGVHALVALATCDAIGLKCESAGCCDVARWSVPWPGRDRALRCDRHTKQTIYIADAMGFRLEGITPLEVRRREEDPSAERFAAMELD